MADFFLKLLHVLLSVILKMSGFTPSEIFVNVGPNPLFQLLEALFWPKRRPKMLKFYPTQNFGLFWAPSLVTLLTFLNVINTWTPEHLNGHKPCSFEGVAGLRPATFSPKNTDYIVCLTPSVFLCCFISVYLGFLLCVVFFVFFCSSLAFLLPRFLTLWKVKGEWGAQKWPKFNMGQNRTSLKLPRWNCRSRLYRFAIFCLFTNKDNSILRSPSPWAFTMTVFFCICSMLFLLHVFVVGVRVAFGMDIDSWLRSWKLMWFYHRFCISLFVFFWGDFVDTWRSGFVCITFDFMCCISSFHVFDVWDFHQVWKCICIHTYIYIFPSFRWKSNSSIFSSRSMLFFLLSTRNVHLQLLCSPSSSSVSFGIADFLHHVDDTLVVKIFFNFFHVDIHPFTERCVRIVNVTNPNQNKKRKCKICQAILAQGHSIQDVKFGVPSAVVVNPMKHHCGGQGKM